MGATVARDSKEAVHQLQVGSEGELDLMKFVKVVVIDLAEVSCFQ